MIYYFTTSVPVVSSSPYSHNFPQPGALQSVSLPTLPNEWTIDLHSELLPQILKSGFSQMQTPIIIHLHLV